MAKNSGNHEGCGASMQARKLKMPGLGCSDPVHYFKTAGVNSILFQQHFQVHQDGKDKPNRKEGLIMR